MSFSMLRSIIVAVWVLNSLNLGLNLAYSQAPSNRSPQNRPQTRSPQGRSPQTAREETDTRRASERMPEGRLRPARQTGQNTESDSPPAGRATARNNPETDAEFRGARTRNAESRDDGARRVLGPPLASDAALMTPPGFDLTPDQQKTIDDMLAFWEQKTSRIKTFRAEFKRWEFDPVHGPKDGNPRTFSQGEIRYSAPDKGMIKVERTFHYDPEKAKSGVKPPLSEKEGEVGEHWVCDGKSVFEFDHAASQLIETRLPPEVQGNAIAEGPLPFMFGAKAATIKSRHWIRELPRSEKEPNYRLELVPFEPNNFSRVIVHLDPKEFIPVIMEVYGLNKVDKMTYQFRGQRINAVADGVGAFLDVFVSPKTPRGWEKIVQDVGPATERSTPPQRQAQRLK